MTALTLSSLSRSLGLSPRGRPVEETAPPPSIVPAGLIAEWRFNSGSGQTLIDYSGNGHHGRLGSTTGSDVNDPVWNAQGLSFDGVNDYVALPSLPSIGALDIVFRPTSTVNSTAASMALFSNIGAAGVLLGSSTALLTNEIVTIHESGAEGYASPNKRAAWTSGSEIISAAWHLLQLDYDPALAQRWHIRLDGVDKQNAAVSVPVAFLPGVGRLGANVSAAGTPYNGTIAYVIAYSGRFLADRDTNRTALTAFLAPRGITLP
jgi:hypothetical protein